MSILSGLSSIVHDATKAERALRLRAALYHADTRTPGLADRLEAVLARAHAEAAAVLDGKAERTDLADLADAWSHLRSDVDGLEKKLPAALPIHVGADGTLWGIGRYLQLDPGWTEALIHWLENHDHPAPFATAPQTITLPDTLRIGVVGDWGTGFWTAGTGPERVRDLLAADRMDVNIHLGDVYYAGSADEERAKFIDLWPAGSLHSFTLNSNHEMYDGARSYYGEALAAGGACAAQRGTSYFAAQNNHWVIVGLDSAYHATGDLYMDGAIDASQGAFLARVAAAAGSRKIIVMTHHLGLDLTGRTPTALWQQVANALGRAPDLWYWGHAHNGIVYAPTAGCLPRCVGHGAIPYGAARMLDNQPTVLWSETQLARDPAVPPRVLNGYLRLTLDGPTVTEELVGEDGSIRWRNA